MHNKILIKFQSSGEVYICIEVIYWKKRTQDLTRYYDLFTSDTRLETTVSIYGVLIYIFLLELIEFIDELYS